MLITNQLAMSIYRALYNRSPASWVFNPGNDGFLNTLSSLSSVFTTDGGSTNPTTPGDAIGRVNNLVTSPDIASVTQNVAAERPTYGVRPFGGRKNLIPNMMVGGVAGGIGATGQFPTGVTRSTSGTGVTWTVAYESGTDPTLGDYVDMLLTLAGTPSSTGQQNLIFSNSGPYPVGTTFTQSAWFKLEAGSMTNTSSLTIRTSSEPGTTFTPTSTLTQYSNTRTITGTSGSWVLRWNYSSAGVAVNQTFRIRLPETINAATASSNPQKVYYPYQIVETGVASINIPYCDGGDTLKTGASAFGAATNGFYAAAGNNWNILVAWSVMNAGTLVAQTEAASGSRMFDLYVDTDLQTKVELRGTVNTIYTTPSIGRWNVASINCDNGTVTARVNGGGRSTLTVGAAAQEIVNILLYGRNATTPANRITGAVLPPQFIDRSLSSLEELQAQRFYMGYLGIA